MPDNIVSTESDGFITRLPNDPDKFFNGIGEWVYIEQTLPDPRNLQATVDLANKIYNESYTDDQADPLLNSYKVTQDAKDAYKAVIDAAQKVLDEFGKNYFSQNDYDKAQTDLTTAMEQFKASGTEVIPNLDVYNQLKDRIETVNTTTVDSVNGKELTFGTKWVTAQQRATAASALATSTDVINKATNYYESTENRKQSKIDTACDTLRTATELYESQIITATPDYSGIDEAISTANKSRTDVVVSSNGEGLDVGVAYVTDQVYLDEFNEKIRKDMVAREEAITQQQLDDAEDKMKEATADFLLILHFTFDWYNIPDDTYWDELPYNSFPPGMDWDRFPWDRIDWLSISKEHINELPWDDDKLFVKAAISHGLERLARSPEAMDAIVNSIIARKELDANGKDVDNYSYVSSTMRSAKTLAVTAGVNPSDFTSVSTVLSNSAAQAAILKNEEAINYVLTDEKTRSQAKGSSSFIKVILANSDLTDRFLQDDMFFTESIGSLSTTLFGSETNTGKVLAKVYNVENETLKSFNTFDEILADDTAVDAISQNKDFMLKIFGLSTYYTKFVENAKKVGQGLATAYEIESDALKGCESLEDISKSSDAMGAIATSLDAVKFLLGNSVTTEAIVTSSYKVGAILATWFGQDDATLKGYNTLSQCVGYSTFMNNAIYNGTNTHPSYISNLIIRSPKAAPTILGSSYFQSAIRNNTNSYKGGETIVKAIMNDATASQTLMKSYTSFCNTLIGTSEQLAKAFVTNLKNIWEYNNSTIYGYIFSNSNCAAAMASSVSYLFDDKTRTTVLGNSTMMQAMGNNSSAISTIFNDDTYTDYIKSNSYFLSQATSQNNINTILDYNSRADRFYKYCTTNVGSGMYQYLLKRNSKHTFFSGLSNCSTMQQVVSSYGYHYGLLMYYYVKVQSSNANYTSNGWNLISSSQSMADYTFSNSSYCSTITGDKDYMKCVMDYSSTWRESFLKSSYNVGRGLNFYGTNSSSFTQNSTLTGLQKFTDVIADNTAWEAALAYSSTRSNISSSTYAMSEIVKNETALETFINKCGTSYLLSTSTSRDAILGGEHKVGLAIATYGSINDDNLKAMETLDEVIADPTAMINIVSNYNLFNNLMGYSSFLDKVLEDETATGILASSYDVMSYIMNNQTYREKFFGGKYRIGEAIATYSGIDNESLKNCQTIEEIANNADLINIVMSNSLAADAFMCAPRGVGQGFSTYASINDESLKAAGSLSAMNTAKIMDIVTKNGKAMEAYVSGKYNFKYMVSNYSNARTSIASRATAMIAVMNNPTACDEFFYNNTSNLGKGLETYAYIEDSKLREISSFYTLCTTSSYQEQFLKVLQNKRIYQKLITSKRTLVSKIGNSSSALSIIINYDPLLDFISSDKALMTVIANLYKSTTTFFNNSTKMIGKAIATLGDSDDETLISLNTLDEVLNNEVGAKIIAETHIIDRFLSTSADMTKISTIKPMVKALMQTPSAFDKLVRYGSYKVGQCFDTYFETSNTTLQGYSSFSSIYGNSTVMEVLSKIKGFNDLLFTNEYSIYCILGNTTYYAGPVLCGHFGIESSVLTTSDSYSNILSSSSLFGEVLNHKDTRELALTNYGSVSKIRTNSTALTTLNGNNDALDFIKENRYFFDVSITSIFNNSTYANTTSSSKNLMAVIMNDDPWKSMFLAGTYKVGQGLDTFAGLNNSTLKNKNKLDDILSDSSLVTTILENETLRNSLLSNSYFIEKLITNPEYLETIINNEGYLSTIFESKFSLDSFLKSTSDVGKAINKYFSLDNETLDTIETLNDVLSNLEILDQIIQTESIYKVLLTSTTASKAISEKLDESSICNIIVKETSVQPTNNTFNSIVNEFLEPVLQNELSLNLVAVNDNIIEEILKQDRSIQELLKSTQATKVIFDSEIAMKLVANSELAMTAIASSLDSLTTLRKSKVAMEAVAIPQVAYDALMNSKYLTFNPGSWYTNTTTTYVYEPGILVSFYATSSSSYYYYVDSSRTNTNVGQWNNSTNVDVDLKVVKAYQEEIYAYWYQLYNQNYGNFDETKGLYYIRC